MLRHPSSRQSHVSIPDGRRLVFSWLIFVVVAVVAGFLEQFKCKKLKNMVETMDLWQRQNMVGAFATWNPHSEHGGRNFDAYLLHIDRGLMVPREGGLTMYLIFYVNYLLMSLFKAPQPMLLNLSLHRTRATSLKMRQQTRKATELIYGRDYERTSKKINRLSDSSKTLASLGTITIPFLFLLA